MAKAKAKELDALLKTVYINPLTDFGFKKIFLNKDLLIAFLNDIIGTQIRDVQYQPTEGLGIVREERVTIFDLLCTTKQEEQFIVEMQLRKQSYFKDRALVYASHVIRKQAKRGSNWKYDLKAVYIVSILNFITFDEKESENEVIEQVYLYRERAQTRFSDKLRMIFIELPKFKKRAIDLHGNTETWLWLLKHTFRLKKRPPNIKGAIFKRFLKIAEVKQLTPKEMGTYKRSLKNSLQMRDADMCARMEGEMKGRMEGEMKGRMEGRMEGRLEWSNQLSWRLLMRNTQIEDIALITDLTVEQIKELVKQLPQS